MCVENRPFSRRQWENRGFLAVLGCKRCGSATDGVLAVSGGGYWSSSCRNDVLVRVQRVGLHIFRLGRCKDSMLEQWPLLPADMVPTNWPSLHYQILLHLQRRNKYRGS